MKPSSCEGARIGQLFGDRWLVRFQTGTHRGIISQEDTVPTLGWRANLRLACRMVGEAACSGVPVLRYCAILRPSA